FRKGRCELVPRAPLTVAVPVVPVSAATAATATTSAAAVSTATATATVPAATAAAGRPRVVVREPAVAREARADAAPPLRRRVLLGRHIVFEVDCGNRLLGLEELSVL